MNLTHFPRENWIKIFKNIEAIYSLITESGEEDLISNIVHFDDSSSGTVNMTEEYIYRLLKTFILNLER